MFTIVVIAILSALAIAQPVSAVQLPWWRAAFSGAAMLSVVSVAALGTRVRVNSGDAAEHDHEIRMWDHMTLWTWAAMSLFCIQVMRWPSLIRLSLGDQVPLVDELLILSSMLMPLLVAWCFNSTADSRAASAPSDSGQSPPASSVSSHWQQLIARTKPAWARFRFALVLSILPLVLISGLSDLVALVHPELPNSGKTLIYAGFLILLVIVFPFAMRTLWRVEPFRANALRERLRALAARHQVRLTNICLWDTGYRVCNAFVAGVIAPVRYIFLTDGLLSELDDEQVELVFAHELGHIVKRHLILRIAALLTPISALVLITSAIFSAHGLDQFATSPSVLPGLELFLTTCCLLFFGLTMGWYSRQLEHEADLWACSKAIGGDRNENVNCYESALRRLAEPADWNRSGWLHPSYQQRCRFLHQRINDGAKALAFSRRMKLIAFTLYLLHAAALVVQVQSLWIHSP